MPQKIFIWYDFKQIRDAILLLLYTEKNKQYEKVFIYESSNCWQTDILKKYTDEKTYKAICKKLKYIFTFRDTTSDYDDLDVQQAIENYSNFLTDVD